MNLFQSTSRALSISLDGLKEAVMNVAERVARRVQVAKLQFQADDAEARLRHAYESLGQCLYATHTAKRLRPRPASMRRSPCVKAFEPSNARCKPYGTGWPPTPRKASPSP